MQKFIQFVVQFKEYITLSALIVMSFSLMTFGNVAQLGGFRTIVVGGIGWLQNVFSFIPNPIALKSENSALRELNLELSTEVTKMRQAALENEKLRRLLALRDQSDYPLVPAEVVGRTTVQLRNYATLSKGAKDGIEQGMIAITDAGLVGIVTSTSENYTLIQLLVDRDMRIAGRLQRTGIDGIVAWEGEQYLVMKNIPKSYDVQAGDLVLTSNFSNKYPADIPLGRVVEVRDDPNALFRRVLLTPTVNFNGLDQVFVVKYKPDEERLSLERKNEQKLKELTSAKTKKKKQHR